MGYDIIDYLNLNGSGKVSKKQMKYILSNYSQFTYKLKISLKNNKVVKVFFILDGGDPME